MIIVSDTVIFYFTQFRSVFRIFWKNPDFQVVITSVIKFEHHFANALIITEMFPDR